LNWVERTLMSLAAGVVLGGISLWMFAMAQADGALMPARKISVGLFSAFLAALFFWAAWTNVSRPKDD